MQDRQQMIKIEDDDNFEVDFDDDFNDDFNDDFEARTKSRSSSSIQRRNGDATKDATTDTATTKTKTKKQLQQQQNRKEDWMAMYYRLFTYKKKHETTRVPIKYKADPQLGQWVFRQRRKCKEKYRIDLLNLIGFVWNIKNDWGDMYERLLAYKEKNGTTDVPRFCTEDPQLGSWASNQRRYCKDDYRIFLLRDIGFVWDKSELRHATWNVMYERLSAYKQKHGNVRVPTRYEADPRLGRWVKVQRQDCKEKNRIDLLNIIGFDWQLKKPDIWRIMYQQLLTYKKIHGSLFFPPGYNEYPKLKKWVATQRYNCKSKDRVDLLNDIGFIWNVT